MELLGVHATMCTEGVFDKDDADVLLSLLEKNKLNQLRIVEKRSGTEAFKIDVFYARYRARVNLLSNLKP
jgi:hypothetical protein